MTPFLQLSLESPELSMTLDGEVIEQVAEFNYLGITLDP